jgi:hypothetical protein
LLPNSGTFKAVQEQRKTDFWHPQMWDCFKVLAGNCCPSEFGSLALDKASKEGPRGKAAEKAAAGPLPAMGDDVMTMKLRVRERTQ